MAQPSSPGALPADQRPLDPTPVHSDDLPPTPLRDRNIPATAWVEAPPALLALGEGLPDEAPPGPRTDARPEGPPVATYKRRIGRWLLWRAGPARGGHTRYLAIDAGALSRSFVFTLTPDGEGRGHGPDGVTHTRFRSWKEALRDS